HQGHEGHHDHHQHGEPVDEEADLQLGLAHGDPGVDRAVEGAALQYFQEHDDRKSKRQQHAEDRHAVRPAAAERLAPQAREDRAGERRKDDDQAQGFEHAVRYPLSESRSSTLMVFRLRNSTTRIARPMADSAAATVRMKNTNTWPAASPRKCEKAMKFRLTASSISSIAISSTIRFFRL